MGTESLGTSKLYPDPADARYMYEVGPAGLTKIDTATWKVLWATTVPLPNPQGNYGDGVQPQFFSGYTETFAFRYLSDYPIPVTDAALTAVNDGGQVLVSCRIPLVARAGVLLPGARILLLADIGSVAAYSTATGGLRWHAPAELSDISGDTVYVTTAQQGGRVVAYDAVSGRRLWSLPVNRGAAAHALMVADGILYLTERLGLVDEYALAVRARDGALLWQRQLASGWWPQISLVTSGFLLALPSPEQVAPVQLIDARSGRLVASAGPGSYQPNSWRLWPAVSRGAPVVVAAGDLDTEPAFIVTSAHGYPPTVPARGGLSLAAVVRNVAYFISSQPCPASSLRVTGVDIRSGRTLWSVPLPSTLCNPQQGSPMLIPYDGGFVIPTGDRHVLLYR